MDVSAQVSASIILAGGDSTRMGQDKALLPWKDQRLLTHICSVAQAIAPVVYVVTPRAEAYGSHVPGGCQLIPETPTVPAAGPLVALTLAIAKLQQQRWMPEPDWILLLACDLPELNVPTLQQGVSRLPHLPTTVDALLPRRQQRWEPLCGFYRWATLTALIDIPHNQIRSFQHWLQHRVIGVWPLNHSEILFNCNTPADWAKVSGHPIETPNHH